MASRSFAKVQRENRKSCWTPVGAGFVLPGDRLTAVGSILGGRDLLGLHGIDLGTENPT